VTAVPYQGGIADVRRGWAVRQYAGVTYPMKLADFH
jgi:hypothetical protein